MGESVSILLLQNALTTVLMRSWPFMAIPDAVQARGRTMVASGDFPRTIRVWGILVLTYSTAPFCKRMSTSGELVSDGGRLMKETYPIVELMPLKLNESCRNSQTHITQPRSLDNLQAYGHSMQWTHRFAFLFQIFVEVLGSL